MSEPKTTPQYTKAPDTGLRVMPRPTTPQSAESLPPPPVYSFENPPPRQQLRPEPAVGAEPGFYIVPRSMSPAELYRELFSAMPNAALRSFSQLNPGLDQTLKAGTLIVLSDPNNRTCTFAESQLLAAAEEVKAALAPLTPDEADFMMRHAAEIATFTGETSTWLGVSAAVMEAHLKRIESVLKKIEALHADNFRRHGHLKSPEFFSERKKLLAQLDDHLLGSKRLRAMTTLDDHHKLKNALGISSRSLVHHWRKAGGAGPIPGYTEHVKAISRATAWMKVGGYIGIGFGAMSGITAIKDVCRNGDESACRKIKFVEGGKFLGATGVGMASGWIAGKAAMPICLLLGPASAGVGTVVCAATAVGIGALVGTLKGSDWGEDAGNFAYEWVYP
ncbi:hypothetical protein NJC40_18145 [Pseudomonas sp. 21LCFQ02]|uniref:hypothetical protein n=1 Tax=Pseudomonas sp. 21LCFQ02 TaxID=2957505 RepID=UPI00209B42CE|nr:hypothetical protein [Pseudomonas sp. 21LCFQ02]MCO8168586.1 hypothetical protein [Pseudomonas sp. 21LCFQ02]MCO8169691.1 hypothetical protein [Pseudomonas sp. 21LCFQ02]